MTLTTIIPPREIRSFTGLRGIAALYVMLYHFKAYNLFGDTLHPFFWHGYLAVDLFFVLSGFVMALTYQALFKNGYSHEAFKKFLGRRIARIYPLYIAVTLFFIAVFTLFPQKIPHDVSLAPGAILTNIAMIQSWGLAPSIVGPGWSISTEWAAYLLFPLLTMAALFRSRIAAILSGVLALAFVGFLAAAPVELLHHGAVRGPLDIWDGTTVWPLLRCLAEFTLGLLCFRVASKTNQETPLCQKLATSEGLPFMTFVLFLIFLALPKADFLAVLILPVLIFSLAADTSRTAKFLGWGPIYWLGTISFSLYLMHPVTFWIRNALAYRLNAAGISSSDFMLMLTQSAVAIIAATFTYYVIEKPGRNILRKWLEPHPSA